MAPEVVLQDYDEQADVWSVGILMWQLLTGRFPFWDDIKSLSLQQVRFGCWSAADSGFGAEPETLFGFRVPDQGCLRRLAS